jgi:hypothetical protein
MKEPPLTTIFTPPPAALYPRVNAGSPCGRDIPLHGNGWFLCGQAVVKRWSSRPKVFRRGWGGHTGGEQEEEEGRGSCGQEVNIEMEREAVKVVRKVVRTGDNEN